MHKEKTQTRSLKWTNPISALKISVDGGFYGFFFNVDLNRKYFKYMRVGLLLLLKQQNFVSFCVQIRFSSCYI